MALGPRAGAAPIERDLLLTEAPGQYFQPGPTQSSLELGQLSYGALPPGGGLPGTAKGLTESLSEFPHTVHLLRERQGSPRESFLSFHLIVHLLCDQGYSSFRRHCPPIDLSALQ